MTWFVTGAGGFIGSHLVRALAADGVPVIAGVRDTTRAGPAPAPATRCVAFDVTAAPGDLRATLAETKPAIVAHLAAQSFPQASWNDPAGTFRVNLEGTVAVVNAMREACPAAKLLLLGSSAEYSPPVGTEALDETAPCEPLSPYGVSKLAAGLAAALLAKRHGLNVTRLRPFFVIGPGKTGDVCSDLARRIVRMERGAEPVLRVGRTDVVRDFLHVADAVAALRRVAAADAMPDIVNICSGTGRSIRELIDAYRVRSRVAFEVREDPALVRAVDEPVKVGSPRVLERMGWSPERTIGDALGEILDDWRAREDA